MKSLILIRTKLTSKISYSSIYYITIMLYRILVTNFCITIKEGPIYNKTIQYEILKQNPNTDR